MRNGKIGKKSLDQALRRVLIRHHISGAELSATIDEIDNEVGFVTDHSPMPQIIATAKVGSFINRPFKKKMLAVLEGLASSTIASLGLIYLFMALVRIIIQD